MARKKILSKIKLTGIADKGRAVGRHQDGRVVFVEGGAAPGDVVDVKVIKKNKRHLVGYPIHYHEYSPDRLEPFCEHFGDCGGCRWQHLSYEEQLKHKFTTTKENIERIGKVEVGEFLPIIPSAETRFYRNKLEFTFSSKRWLTQKEVDSAADFNNRNGLGFHRPKAFDKVVDVRKCFLQPAPSNALRNAIRAFALAHNYEFFDIRNKKGLLRSLIIRTSSLGEVMVVVSFFQDLAEQRQALLEYILEQFPNLTSLQYVINPKGNATIYDLAIHCYHGRPFIYEQLKHVRFKIGPKSFFQTNSLQAIQLYDVVVRFAEFTGEENVYDLYTGIGSIALYIAHLCRKVVGIEEIEAAIDDAHINMKINQIKNATFYAGDVKEILTDDFAKKHERPDIVITDPPRAGMHATVVEMLLQLEAPKIIYVSCNPATQARDINLLSQKYEVIRVQPVDMFPHTHHIESVALLKLKLNL